MSEVPKAGAIYWEIAVESTETPMDEILREFNIPFAQTDPQSLQISECGKKYVGKGDVFDIIPTPAKLAQLEHGLVANGIQDIVDVKRFPRYVTDLRTIGGYKASLDRRVSALDTTTLGKTIYKFSPETSTKIVNS